MTKRIHEKGFTLLELLLVTGVSAVLLLGLTKMTQSWVDSELATGSGQHLNRISTVVQEYVEARWGVLTPTNDAIAEGTNVAAPGYAVWSGLVDNLDEEGLLNAGNTLHNPMGFDLQIAYKSEVIGTKTVYSAAVFSKTPQPNGRIVAAARQAGNLGGSVTSFPDIAFATGAFGQWSVPKNSLMASGAFPCIATARMGCLVARTSYTDESLAGPYLYREDMPDPANELNTMYTDLFMNNTRIVGASDVRTEDLNVRDRALLGETTIDDTATFNGTTTVNEGLTANQGMAVSGAATFTGNVTMDTATLNATQLNTSTLRAPAIATNKLDAVNMTINNGSLVVDDSISINGNVTMTRNNSEIFAGTINAGQIDANNGQLTVGSVDVRNTLEINGSLDVTSGAIVAERLVTDKCVQIDDGLGTGTYNKYGADCPP